MENKVIAKEYVDKNYININELVKDYNLLEETNPKDLVAFYIRHGAMEYIRQLLEKKGIKLEDK